MELLRVLADSRVKSLTLITSREKLHEASIEVETYSLPGLNLAAWQEYFNHQKIIINNESLQEIRDAFGGNAKAMNVISKAIIKDYDGDLEKYWLKNKKDLLIEPTLENLIKEQFKRLQEINLNDAYNLLCRMGCYRYQDVPTVPENGLCSLLWDVAENNHQRIIKVLRERALVEFNNDEYWLHPVIRQEAIDRLKNSEDWEKANIKAGEFWKNHNNSIKNKEEALTYIESLLHYYEAHKYELAFYVLYERVHIENSNRFLGNQLIYWGYSFYLINFLKKLIRKLPKYLEVYALLRIGICFYYIGNYEESAKFLNQAIEIMKIFPDDYQYQKAYPECLNCLARTTIRLGNLNKGVQICGQALSKIQFIKSRFDLEISQDPDISVQKYFYFERQESNTLQTVSEINFYLAEYEKAIQKCHQGLQIIKNVKNNKFYKEEGDIIAILSICWYAKGKVKRAIRMMEKAILNFQIFEDKQSEGFARCYLTLFLQEN